MRYELGFYIQEDSILHSHCCENLNSYMVVTVRIPYSFLIAVFIFTELLLNRIPRILSQPFQEQTPNQHLTTSKHTANPYHLQQLPRQAYTPT
jgi:hypothetical protein